MNEVFFSKEKFPEFSSENSGAGILKIQAFATNQAFPIRGVEIEISKDINGEKVIFFQGVTDYSGIIDQIVLPTKVPKKTVEQASDVIFTTYTITAKYPVSDLKRVYEVGIFDNIKVIQPIKFSAMNIIEGGMENE